MVKPLAVRYAEAYALREDRLLDQEDGRSSIHYPALFLFAGDLSRDAVMSVLACCRRKWDNAGGVMAVQAVSEDGATAGSPAAAGPGDGPRAENIRQLLLPATRGRDPKTVRRDIGRDFRQDGRYLAGMNRVLRQISNSIADYGRLYSSFDVIHLTIITRVDDPLNVFLPELTLLARTILGQSFKSVQTDLYVLINEREQENHYAYSSSLGLAFLRELEGMQSPDYALTAPLLVTEDGLSIPVVHGPAPLFDLVYLLGDKNERGMMPAGGMHDNYEIIAHISLLKNRVRTSADAAGQGGYNNMTFKSGIRGGSGRQGYASAGWSGVKRPNRQIALAVLYHTFRVLAGSMKNSAPWSLKERQGYLGLDAEHLREETLRLLPEEAGLEEMTGLMSHGRPSYQELKNLSLLEAERTLFGGGAEEYFRGNFEAEAARRLEECQPGREWAGLLAAHEAGPPVVTFYQLADWTGEREDAGSVLVPLRQHMRSLEAAIRTARGELESVYADRVDRQPFQRVPLLDKRTVRNFIHYLFSEIYGRKYELLRMETELALCRRLESGLEALHGECSARVRLMESLERELREIAEESAGSAGSGEIGQNIMEYYGAVTEETMRETESRRGPGFWFGERALGSVSVLLDRGKEALVARLAEVCEREVLTHDVFSLSFEEELLRRANVAAAYENRQILTKEELFKRLYFSLEQGAVANVRLFEYTQEHRHEEKYFFGDSRSEFLRYAQEADETTRTYRLGFVHEQRRSGVEKLNLMGGFHLEDLLYYRNGKMYYETYAASGYSLHGDDPGPLPELR